MLGSLTGHVSARLGQRILVEVQGIGYWVHTGAWQPSGEITCYLYHNIREDINDLFGFPTVESLELFERLISTSGVGPKAGLAVLSLGEPNRIISAIVRSDISFLTLAPGIGKKAAEKIIIELKGKLHEIETASPDSVLHDDLRAALEGLGYKIADLQPYLATIPPEHTTINAQIRWVLQQLAK